MPLDGTARKSPCPLSWPTKPRREERYCSEPSDRHRHASPRGELLLERVGGHGKCAGSSLAKVGWARKETAMDVDEVDYRCNHTDEQIQQILNATPR